MIKTYIHNGKEFQTITIPAGTALFRGIDYDETNLFRIFYDLIGYNNCIAPTNNICFYPVPYVSECIKSFKIHIIYTTNYDIELLLLIKPSDITRKIRHEYNKNDIITTCSNISAIDKCGGKLNDVDICFTDNMISNFPHIAGYIALAEADAIQFKLQYKRLMDHGKKKQIMQIMPCISSNSRGITGVPEIVIHPLHFRRLSSYNIRETFRYPVDVISYCTRNRAQYNFFPVLYIYSNGIFSFNDLKSEKVLALLQKIDAPNGPIKNPLLTILKKIMNKLLTPSGYDNNGINYKLSIDMKTGYYIFDTHVINKSEDKEYRGKIHITNKTGSENSIIPYSYSMQDKYKIMKAMSLGYPLTEEELETYLNKKGFSLKTKYILDKGGNTYRKKYNVDKVISNAPLLPLHRNKTRKNIEKKRLANIYEKLGLYDY